MFSILERLSVAFGTHLFLTCNYESVYLGVSCFNIPDQVQFNISQTSDDRCAIFVLLIIYEKFESHYLFTLKFDIGINISINREYKLDQMPDISYVTIIIY